jgi:ProP effector
MSETLPPTGELPDATADLPASDDVPLAAEAAAEAPLEVAVDAVAAEPAPAAPPVPAVPELSPAACGARLAALFPALFAQRAQPLKLRIQADIQQRAPGIFTRKTLSAFLHRHTTTNAYLMSLTQAPQRVDLDGAPAGEITEEHRQAAVQELARRRSLFEERRAVEQAARRAAESQARQAHAAQDQARRDRAALLRAVETSTLTRANFCALKGMTEADLDAQLVQARAEALQRAQEPRPEPRFDDRRGPGPGHESRRDHAGPRHDGAPPAGGRGPRPDAPRGPRPGRDGGRGQPRR